MPIMRRNRQGKMVLKEEQGPSPEELYFFDDPLRDMNSMPDIHKYVTYPKVIGDKITENFDLTDAKTRKYLLNLDEAGQSSVLTSLTSKLYDHIVKKTTDIDYGKIPASKGDITKLDFYGDLKDVCEIIKGILKEYNEKSGPIDTVTLAMANVESRKDLFMRAYRADCEFPIMIYQNTVLAIVNAVSYLIAGCIEFIKAPSDETYTIQLDKIAYAKSRDHLLYTSLDHFNKSCASGDMDRAMNEIINKRVRKFTGATAATIVAGTVIGVVIILNIVPVLRELVYVLYYTRTRIADYFELQADLLQMNAYNVQANTAMDPEDRKEIADEQMQIVAKFRKIANAVQIDAKQSDVKASRELESSGKKYKVDDVLDKEVEDDGAEGVSSLF